ncbi:hypothetical protein PR202_gb17749 [Eleusine coracana subsp. coracana]|uniref:Uncharacterized protein n=1 Tax=Eleusine coracana subsp. coracana TaxID=191504 RepID=A0AAV5F350_ELECO|nr:hypothetical protein PR202_gb17749 [Eleusine coracana subsp. coracana]
MSTQGPFYSSWDYEQETREIILRIPPPPPAAPEPPPPTCNSYDNLQKSRCLDLFNQGKSTFESFDLEQVEKTCKLFSGKTYTCVSTERTPSVTKDCCKIMSHTCLCDMRKGVGRSKRLYTSGSEAVGLVCMEVRSCGRFGAYSSVRSKKCVLGSTELEFSYDTFSVLMILHHGVHKIVVEL